MATSISKFKAAGKKGWINKDNTLSDDAQMYVDTEAGVAMDQRINKARGMMTNLAINPNMYADNALTSELTQAQSAFGVMKKKGGIGAAVAQDVASAELAAAESQDAFKGKLKAFKAKGSTLSDQVDNIESKARSLAGRQSFVQTASAVQDMSMKDGHGGFENIALKSAAMQTAGQIADVKGFNSNYKGMEGFISDSTQQARKKYASTHGAAAAIADWGNAALAQNAEFSERSSIGSAQVQIRDDGGSAKSAAAVMVRKAAADMQGLVRTQNKLDTMGGYEATSAYMAEQMAIQTLEALTGDLNAGLAEVVPVTNKKGKVVGSKIQTTQKAEESANVSGANAAKVKETKATAAMDEGSRAVMATNQLQRLTDANGGDSKKAIATMVMSGTLSGNRNKDGHLELANKYNAIDAMAYQLASPEIGGGIKGAVMADGTKMVMQAGFNAKTGKIDNMKVKFDGSQINSMNKGTNLNVQAGLEEEAAGVVGDSTTTQKALEVVGALTLGATINKASGYVLPKSNTIGSDGTTKAVRTTAMGWAGKGMQAVGDKLSPFKKGPKEPSGKPDNAGGNNKGDKAQKSSFNHDDSSKSSMSNSTPETEKMQASERSKINSMGTKMNAAMNAAEHGGNIRNRAGAFLGTMFATSAMTSMLSSDGQAAEVPVKVTAKPVIAGGSSKGLLDQASDNLGNAALGTGLLSLASKTAARIAPGVGMAYGVVDTVNRESKGDHLGAAMSAGIALASTVPVAGTALAVLRRV